MNRRNVIFHFEATFSFCVIVPGMVLCCLSKRLFSFAVWWFAAQLSGIRSLLAVIPLELVFSVRGNGSKWEEKVERGRIVKYSRNVLNSHIYNIVHDIYFAFIEQKFAWNAHYFVINAFGFNHYFISFFLSRNDFLHLLICCMLPTKVLCLLCLC